MSVLDLIEKFGEHEDRITETDFISPIFYNRKVATRLYGIVYSFSIPKKEPGWYKFRPVDQRNAQIIEEASLEEREDYLKRMPVKLRMTLVYSSDGLYFGLPEKNNPLELLQTDPVPIYLCDDMTQDFDIVICRYDGMNIWFDQVDMNNDPAKAEYLRDSLREYRKPRELQFSGLIHEEKMAYGIRHKINEKILEEQRRNSLQGHVEHAGGKFIDSQEQSDHYLVTYEVDGSRYTSSVSKDTRHQVITAGICLSGGDRAFDLKSLITVMREGQERDVIHHE